MEILIWTLPYSIVPIILVTIIILCPLYLFRAYD